MPRRSVIYFFQLFPENDNEPWWLIVVSMSLAEIWTNTFESALREMCLIFGTSEQRKPNQLMLTLSMLGNIFSRRHFDFCFLIFPRKQVLTYHATSICMECRILISYILNPVFMIYFSYSPWTFYCGYWLKSPHREGSNEHLQHFCSCKNKI